MRHQVGVLELVKVNLLVYFADPLLHCRCILVAVEEDVKERCPFQSFFLANHREFVFVLTNYIQNVVHVFERLFKFPGVLALLGGSLFFQQVLITVFQAMKDDLAGDAFL